MKALLFCSFTCAEDPLLSDVDLLVLYDENARVCPLKHCAIINDIEDLLDRPVDLVEDEALMPIAVDSVNQDK